MRGAFEVTRVINWKRSDRGDSRPTHSWPELSEALPVDVLPCSNDEYFPPPPTPQQLAIMELAEPRDRALAAQVRDDAARSSCAPRRRRRSASGRSTPSRAGEFGNYGCAHNTDDDRRLRPRVGRPARALRDAAATCPASSSSTSSPTTSIRTGMWRVTNPAIHAFFAAVWPQSSSVTGDQPGVREDGSIRGGGAGEIDPIENLSRFHYLKELFLDSATTATVLSCVPTSPDTNNPLPLAEAAADGRHRQRARASSHALR